MFGPPLIVSTPGTTQSPCQSQGYKNRYSELLELQKQAEKKGVIFLAIMPPNICDPKKIPLDALGGRSIEPRKALTAGQPVTLRRGCNTLIGPCDAADAAQDFSLLRKNSTLRLGNFSTSTRPKFTPEEKMERAVNWMRREKLL